jgi:steroid delta-isomerase-like uncharacterized protein
MNNLTGSDAHGVRLLKQWRQEAQSPDSVRLEDIFAADIVYTDLAMGRVCHGLDELRQFWTSWAAALPDQRCECHMVIGDDEQAVMFWTFTGRYAGGVPGLPVVMGESNYDVSGVSLAVVTEGKIAQHWDVYDGSTFFRQLGLLDEFLNMTRQAPAADDQSRFDG